MATMHKMSDRFGTRRSTNAFEVSGDSSRALANAAETWFSAVTECQREMIGFVSMRLEKDSETAREMIGCKTPAEVAAIQSSWIEETLRDYNSEIAKLMALCTKAVNGKS